MIVNNMIVLGNDDFGEKLAEKLGTKFSRIEQRVFPDGEVCPRIIDGINDNHAVVALRMKLPLDPNMYLIEILFTIKNLKSLGVKKIDVVMPYFVYARQDKAFRKGEPFSAKYVIELLKEAGTSRFFTVTSHADRNKEKISLSDSAYSIDGFVAVGNYLKENNLKNPLIIAPDDGAEKFAETIAIHIGCEYAVFEKHRDLDTGSVSMKSSVDMKGKNVIIVDDIISSGGTMLKAIDLCKNNGAKSVMAAVVHVVSEKGIRNIKSLVAMDTIDSDVSKISVVELMADRIKSLI